MLNTFMAHLFSDLLRSWAKKIDSPFVSLFCLRSNKGKLVANIRSFWCFLKQLKNQGIPYSDVLLAPSDATLAPLHEGRLLVPGKNWQWLCLISQFVCPSSKIAQPRYAKGASEGAKMIYYGFLEEYLSLAWRYLTYCLLQLTRKGKWHHNAIRCQSQATILWNRFNILISISRCV